MLDLTKLAPQESADETRRGAWPGRSASSTWSTTKEHVLNPSTAERMARSSRAVAPSQAAAEYWKTALLDAPELLELPTDHPRPAQPHYTGARWKG